MRKKTGFAIGGVPPLGHREKPVTLIDEGLLPDEGLWAAAGTPHAVFRLSPDDLLKTTGGRLAEVTYGKSTILINEGS